MTSTSKYNVGDRVGQLLLMERVSSDKWGNPLWRCLCDCGTEKIIRSSSLMDRTQSCGCYQKKHRFGGVGELPKAYWSSILRGASKRKIPVSVSIEDAWNLFLKQSRTCAITKLPLTFKSENHTCFGTASLDRIDSTKDYTKDNIWWVHKDINKMKMDLPLKKFQEMCQLVTQGGMLVG